MKIKRLRSISARINTGMLVILLALFSITGVSMWMTNNFNSLSTLVSEQLLPELSQSSDIHLAIKNVHKKMDALPYSTSNAGNRVIVQNLITELERINISISNVTRDKYSQSLINMTKELSPIINAYSLEVANSIHIDKQIRRQTEHLDTAYFQVIGPLNQSYSVYRDDINLLYIAARSLPDLGTTFLFIKELRDINKVIHKLRNSNLQDTRMLDVIDNSNNGIITLLKKQSRISVNLSVLSTQTNVIVEQLLVISLAKLTALKEKVQQGTQAIKDTSTQYTKYLISIVLLTSLFTAVLMYFFHQSISKRLIRIAKSIGTTENQDVLIKESNGHSEISIISKSIMRYISRNEQQKKEIKDNVKQLMFIVENSSQAVIIYSNNKIAYCNQYCQQLLDVDTYSKNDIVSQNLLMAIETSSYEERLQVGDFYFRFNATEIDWNSTKATLALLTDISNEVKKETQLMQTLEIVTDESLTDTLTGLYNRRKLDLIIETELHAEYAIIIADIDWFKAFNDYYGHAEGDVCITKVAMAIKESLRTNDDIAVRYGGEEFVVLLLGSSIEEAKVVAQRIQTIITKFDIKHEKSEFNQLSLSLGISHSSEINNDNWQSLFELADKRLYHAKASGRARIVSSDDDRALIEIEQSSSSVS